MFIFKLWSHLDLLSFVKIVKVNYVLPTYYFAMISKSVFFKLLQIFYNKWEGHREQISFCHHILCMVCKSDIFHLMEKASVI